MSIWHEGDNFEHFIDAVLERVDRGHCPRCGSADWIPADEGSWPSCNDCGFIQYDPETLALQREVQREQAQCKAVLGYVPEYEEAVRKGLIKP